MRQCACGKEIGSKSKKDQCRSCYMKAYLAKYYKNNKEELDARNMDYYHDHKDHIRGLQKEYREEHKDEMKRYQRKYVETHKEKRAESSLRYQQTKGKLSHIARNRLLSALKGKSKYGSAIRDLGCSLSEFKSYIESIFQPGMTWENWGRYGWHLDHIKPISKFDLTDPEQLKQAVHYTNLQPLWAEDNLRKHNKLGGAELTTRS